jgi:thiol-disulfide isomerase/thioredoxin
MGPLRKQQGEFTVQNPVTVDDESKIQDAVKLIRIGPATFILVYADWCGHCQKYKPFWKTLGDTPGRTANIVSIREDMLPKIPGIAGAKIQGYPSVIKVMPSGKIKEYKVDNSEEVTNAMPIMRDMAEMKKELTQTPPTDRRRPDSKTPGPQSGLSMSGGFLADSVLGSLFGAVKQAAPAALLLLGGSMLPKKRKTFKSPKRSSHRASTRRNRRR